MKLSIPKPLREGKHIHKLGGGSFIQVNVCYNTHFMRIHIAPEGEKVIKEKEKDFYCLCLPHFVIAKVKAVYPETPSEEFLLDGQFTYDLDVCTESQYILFEGALDPNFGRYYVGQTVLVTIGESMDEWDFPLDCGRSCLMQSPRFDILAISPISINDMSLWLEVP